MAFFNKTDDKTEEKIQHGRVATLSSNLLTIRQSSSFTANILDQLTTASSNKFTAVDLLVDKTPYGRMALNVYTTLSNPEGEYHFFHANTGRRTKTPENAFNQFCSRRWANNDAGIDGVYESLLRSFYTRGEAAFEFVVANDLSDISQIMIIDPATYDSFEWIDAENRYALYQSRTDNQKIDLYSGNFFRFPYQTNINNPLGVVPFEPAIQASLDFYQHLTDYTAYLNRIGYPRYDVEIDDEAVLAMAEVHEKNTQEKRNALLREVFDEVETNLRTISRDSDMVHFKSNKVGILGGNSVGIDVRAWFEVDAPSVCNAYGLPKIYMNMESGGSYALGNAEQEAFIKRIDNSRDKFVAIKEAVGNFFCRVYGYNATCKFVPQPIEWEKMEEKWNANNYKATFYKTLYEMGIIDIDETANILHGADKAADPNKTSTTTTGGTTNE